MVADGLITSKPQTPKFYISPKIHKENNPGRPIINSINCHMSKISKYVDYHLQPIMKEIHHMKKTLTTKLTTTISQNSQHLSHLM